jgi:hypothetical protein
MTIEKIEGPVPFLLNLGQPESIVGWAQLYRKEDGKVQMVVDMGDKGTELMDHFVEIADIKGIGFAGVLRHPENRDRLPS